MCGRRAATRYGGRALVPERLPRLALIGNPNLG